MHNKDVPRDIDKILESILLIDISAYKHTYEKADEYIAEFNEKIVVPYSSVVKLLKDKYNEITNQIKIKEFKEKKYNSRVKDLMDTENHDRIVGQYIERSNGIYSQGDFDLLIKLNNIMDQVINDYPLEKYTIPEDKDLNKKIYDISKSFEGIKRNVDHIKYYNKDIGEKLSTNIGNIYNDVTNAYRMSEFSLIKSDIFLIKSDIDKIKFKTKDSYIKALAIEKSLKEVLEGSDELEKNKLKARLEYEKAEENIKKYNDTKTCYMMCCSLRGKITKIKEFMNTNAIEVNKEITKLEGDISTIFENINNKKTIKEEEFYNIIELLNKANLDANLILNNAVEKIQREYAKEVKIILEVEKKIPQFLSEIKEEYKELDNDLEKMKSFQEDVYENRKEIIERTYRGDSILYYYYKKAMTIDEILKDNLKKAKNNFIEISNSELSKWELFIKMLDKIFIAIVTVLSFGTHPFSNYDEGIALLRENKENFLEKVKKNEKIVEEGILTGEDKANPKICENTKYLNNDENKEYSFEMKNINNKNK